MSEVRLNLIDNERILQGTIHGSLVDICVAALAAEPETIAELDAALKRYCRAIASGTIPTSATNQLRHFAWFHEVSEIDSRKWDAGVVMIDLAARLVASESTYSQLRAEGEVRFHDETKSTDIVLPYRLGSEWKFLTSIAEYESCRASRAREWAAQHRHDARSVLYGRPLLEFIATNVRQSPIVATAMPRADETVETASEPAMVARSDESLEQQKEEAAERIFADEVSALHANWLLTSREDLHGQSPRDVLLARQDLVDFDLHTRSLQWTFQGEGPPVLSQDSFAYRFGGFGTHEWVIYYDLVRYLLGTALERQTLQGARLDLETEITRLEQIRNEWLENPQEDGGRVPANIIESERRRLPLTVTPQEMMVDEDCPLCVMSANEAAMGYGPGFWHLDGSHMDDEFAFSFYRTREEWEEENRRREEFDREFDRRWKEREERRARGEPIDDEFDLDWITPEESKSIVRDPSEDEEAGPVQ